MAARMDMIDFRQLLEDDYRRRMNLRQENKDAFHDLLDEIKQLDPLGWAEWYDKEVPDWNDWENCDTVLRVLSERAEDLRDHILILSQKTPAVTTLDG